MSGLLERIGQMAVFLICAQTLIHFRANDTYEKYMKLLVSMILLILILEPLNTVFGNSIEGSIAKRIGSYEIRLQEIMSEPNQLSDEIESMLQNISEQKVLEGIEYTEANSFDEDESGVEKESIEQVEIKSVPIKVDKINLGGSNGEFEESP